MGVENGMFGSGLGDLGRTPLQKIIRRTPPPPPLG